MSKFQVNINLEDADLEGSPVEGIARILRVVAHRVEAGERSGNIRDLNGNTIGTFLRSAKLERAGKVKRWGKQF